MAPKASELIALPRGWWIRRQPVRAVLRTGVEGQLLALRYFFSE